MTQQKSEDYIVPEGQRKLVPTQRPRASGGGKVVSVDKRVWQPKLPFATAENPSGTSGGAGMDLSMPTPCEAPKANDKGRKSARATIREVRSNLTEALKHVSRNRGGSSPDGQTLTDLRR